MLHVGLDTENVPDDWLRDNTLDNIAAKNKSYCEMTGLYWIWKNVHEEYVGLEHYRRFFAKTDGIVFNTNHYVFRRRFRLMGEADLKDILNEYDICVKISRYRSIGNEQAFAKSIPEIQTYMKNAFLEIHPEYTQCYNEYAAKHRHYNCNMFYCEKDLIDRYCEWIFPILNYIDEEHCHETGMYYNNRELGYVAEFLFGMWIHYNNLKAKVVAVVSININRNEGLIRPISRLPIDFFRFIKRQIIAVNNIKGI